MHVLMFICLFALFMGHEQCKRHWSLKKKKKKKEKTKNADTSDVNVNQTNTSIYSDGKYNDGDKLIEYSKSQGVFRKVSCYLP